MFVLASPSYRHLTTFGSEVNFGGFGNVLPWHILAGDQRSVACSLLPQMAQMDADIRGNSNSTPITALATDRKERKERIERGL